MPFLIILGILILTLIVGLIIWPIPTLLVVSGIAGLLVLLASVGALLNALETRKANREWKRWREAQQQQH